MKHSIKNISSTEISDRRELQHLYALEVVYHGFMKKELKIQETWHQSSFLSKQFKMYFLKYFFTSCSSLLISLLAVIPICLSNASRLHPF